MHLLLVCKSGAQYTYEFNLGRSRSLELAQWASITKASSGKHKSVSTALWH